MKQDLRSQRSICLPSSQELNDSRPIPKIDTATGQILWSCTSEANSFDCRCQGCLVRKELHEDHGIQVAQASRRTCMRCWELKAPGVQSWRMRNFWDALQLC